MSARDEEILQLLTYVLERVDRLSDRFDRLETFLFNESRTTMADLSKILASVNAATTADASIVALCQNIAAELKAAKGDQAQIDALADQLAAGTSDVVAAVNANTPAAPPAPPAPAPTPAA